MLILTQNTFHDDEQITIDGELHRRVVDIQRFFDFAKRVLAAGFRHQRR